MLAIILVVVPQVRDERIKELEGQVEAQNGVLQASMRRGGPGQRPRNNADAGGGRRVEVTPSVFCIVSCARARWA